jgi:hypothetical protein
VARAGPTLRRVLGQDLMDLSHLLYCERHDALGGRVYLSTALNKLAMWRDPHFWVSDDDAISAPTPRCDAINA